MKTPYTKLLVILLTLSSIQVGFSQRDTHSDTWVAIDELGRPSPDNASVGNPKSGKTVGMFYYIWLQEIGGWNIHDISKIKKGQQQYGGAPSFHHWGESLYGYYSSRDEFVIRKHMQMFTDAGIDYLFFDNTNGEIYQDVQERFLNILLAMKAEGKKVPQISWAMYNGDVNAEVEKLYNTIATKPQYQSLFQQWEGKPLLLASYSGGRSDVANFFKFKKSWAWTSQGWYKETGGRDRWPWLEDYPQKPGLNAAGQVEQMSVSAAHHPHGAYAIGKSTGADRTQAPQFGNDGKYFQLQWDRALQVNPPMIMLTQWNEWIAQRFLYQDPQWHQPVTHMERKQLQPGESIFIDLSSAEYSRDLEPLRTDYRDNMYMQMVNNIRKYKGVRPYRKGSGAKSITINNDFNQWSGVGPEYLDDINDIPHRNHVSFGSDLTYTNTTGRNDIDAMKISQDGQYIYFYVKTKNNLTAHTDPRWMNLLINSDAKYNTGWNGYDFIVNHSVNSATSTTLKKHAGGGFSWNSSQNIEYFYSGNQMHIRISKQTLGIPSSGTFNLDFKWVDNTISTGDIIDCYVDGDAAPNSRYNYRYIGDGIQTLVWDFDTNQEGWALTNNLTGAVNNGVLDMTVTNGDPFMHSPNGLNADAATYPYIHVRANNLTNATEGELFFITQNDNVWNGAKRISFPLQGSGAGFQDYIINLSQFAEWKGVITQVRLDPSIGNNGQFNIDRIAFMKQINWGFATDLENWTLTNNVTGAVNGGNLNLTITKDDPFIHSPNNINAPTSKFPYLVIRADNQTNATEGEVFFTTNEDKNWDGAKRISFPLLPSGSGFQEYTVDLSTISGWKGSVQQIRVDPIVGSSGNFIIDNIKLTSDELITGDYGVNEEIYGMTIYPNPAKNRINIVFKNPMSSDYKVQIMNTLGVVVYSKTAVDGAQQINTENWAKGIYLVKVFNTNATHTSKIEIVE